MLVCPVALLVLAIVEEAYSRRGSERWLRAAVLLGAVFVHPVELMRSHRETKSPDIVLETRYHEAGTIRLLAQGQRALDGPLRAAAGDGQAHGTARSQASSSPHEHTSAHVGNAPEGIQTCLNDIWYLLNMDSS